MNLTKIVSAVVSGLLVLGGAVGIPGLDNPGVAELAEKIAASLGTLLTGWVFMRGEWLGVKPKPQAPKYEGQ